MPQIMQGYRQDAGPGETKRWRVWSSSSLIPYLSIDVRCCGWRHGSVIYRDDRTGTTFLLRLPSAPVEEKLLPPICRGSGSGGAARAKQWFASARPEVSARAE